MFTIFTDTRFDFMAHRRVAYSFSAALILIGIVSVIMHGGLRLGIDFAGGRLIGLRTSEHVIVEDVRTAVETAGFEGAEIQAVRGSNDVLIRIPEVSNQRGGDASPSSRIMTTMKSQLSGVEVELLREELVGAKIGGEIRKQAFWAILLSLGLILLYIAFRFEFRFGLGAVAALAHDMLITLTFFSLFDKEITMPVVAALLTIAGYSINDTIVVFDRIREQLVRLRRESFFNVLNISINQTLSRTVITAMTTLFAALALYIFGGEVIKDFAFAMSVGIVVGTFSSIFVASALVLELRKAKEARGEA